jgi:hypothetical protein
MSSDVSMMFLATARDPKLAVLPVYGSAAAGCARLGHRVKLAHYVVDG